MFDYIKLFFYKLSGCGFESLLVATYVLHIAQDLSNEFLDYSGNFKVTINLTQVQKQDKNKQREVFFKTSSLILISASYENLSSIVLFQISTLFFHIFIHLYFYLFFHFPSYQLHRIKNHQWDMFQLHRFSFHGKNLHK